METNNRISTLLSGLYPISIYSENIGQNTQNVVHWQFNDF